MKFASRTAAALLAFAVAPLPAFAATDTTSTDRAIYNSREGAVQRPAVVVQVAP